VDIYFDNDDDDDDNDCIHVLSLFFCPLTFVNPFRYRDSNLSWPHLLRRLGRFCWRPPFYQSANCLKGAHLQSKMIVGTSRARLSPVKATPPRRMVFDGTEHQKGGPSRSTYLNCFVKSSSTSSSSQLSCQSGSAFPPDALFSESNTLPDCSATNQLMRFTFHSSTPRLEELRQHTSCWKVLIVSVGQKWKGQGRTSNSSSSSKAPNWGNFFFSPSGFFSVVGAPTSPATFSFDCCWSLLVSDIML